MHTVKSSNSSTWPIDGTLLGTTTPEQSGPRSNGNEGVLQIPQSSRTRASPSDAVESHIQDTFWREVLPFCRDAIGIFYSPSWLSYINFKGGEFLKNEKFPFSVIQFWSFNYTSFFLLKKKNKKKKLQTESHSGKGQVLFLFFNTENYRLFGNGAVYKS